jgi:non-heme chloroperoxidase
VIPGIRPTYREKEYHDHSNSVAGFLTAFCAFFFTLSSSLAQELSEWHDPSPHTIQFITADKDVRLGVLDWGGTGRPLVFFSGLGKTAHAFDELHRGSHRSITFTASRVWDTALRAFPSPGIQPTDWVMTFLAVLDSLKLNRPVLVWHAMRGTELRRITAPQKSRRARSRTGQMFSAR